MATIINNRSNLITDPIRNFRFLVKFMPIGGNNASDASTALGEAVHFGFTSVSGLSVTTDSIPYREGGYNTTVHQIPGQTSFTPLNLQRGVILGTPYAWDWMRDLFATVQGGARRGVSQNFRCDIEIDVLSHPIPAGQSDILPSGADDTDDHVAMRFKVYNAWITSVAYSDLNAGDNALFVEQMVLVHEGFDVKWANDLTTTAAEFDEGLTAPTA
jgi:phage tail-like protein